MTSWHLRVLLRIWMVVFALGAIDFFLFPYQTVQALNDAGAAVGMGGVPPIGAGQDFWLTLAVPYMLVVTALSWLAQNGERIAAQPVQLLIFAKAASSLTSLALFLAYGYAYAFLGNFLLDGAIALITYWFYREARAELV
jgi:hypothetical protein